MLLLTSMSMLPDYGTCMAVLSNPSKGRSHVSKIEGVHLFFLSLQTSDYSGRRRREERNGAPSPADYGDWGASLRRKLPQRGLERSPSRERFWGVSCAILCDFMHILVPLTAAWKWEVPTSLYWLVGLISPFKFFEVSGTPTWIFLGCLDTHDTHSGCAIVEHKNDMKESRNLHNSTHMRPLDRLQRTYLKVWKIITEHNKHQRMKPEILNHKIIRLRKTTGTENTRVYTKCRK